MRRWFLSYTSQDVELMRALKIALEQRDTDSHTFFAPEAMRAGGFWQKQLADEIKQSTAFILLVPEKEMGPWQVLEYYEALDRRAKEQNYPLILVLSSKRSAPGLPFAPQLHWVVTEDPASEATIGRLIEAASRPATRPAQLWRHTRPYRGLEAMTEASSDFFFGRGRETVEVLNALATERGKLPLLVGNSGVGKSSLAQAGVLAALMRQQWPDHIKEAGRWPAAFDRSRQWCFLTLRPGTHPVKALVDVFLERWHLDAGAEWMNQRKQLVELLLSGNATLSDLLDATEMRYRQLQQPFPPAFFLYIDQGEELYVRAEKQQRRCFSKIVAAGLSDPRFHALMSLRADFFGELLNDEPLYAVHRLVKVPPLRKDELLEIVSKPAQLLSARFETDTLAARIAERTAEESAEDVGALPLLSYLLDDMWSTMVHDGKGVLRLPMQAIDLGRVLVDRAKEFAEKHPNLENVLRRIMTLRLATVREDGQTTRRRALRSEFSDEEWGLVCDLADHPYRLLVTTTAEDGATYAEVAHEAIFRRWDQVRQWVSAEIEFLAWRSGLEAARRAWQATPVPSQNDALLMGHALAQAGDWLTKRSKDLAAAERNFIVLSLTVAQRKRRRFQALVGVLAIAVAVSLLGWWNNDFLVQKARWLVITVPYQRAQIRPLTKAVELELVPGQSFKECTSDCPEMVVVPAGSFAMGAPSTERGHKANEEPQHTVTIAKPFAVSKYLLTFDEWDACTKYGDCKKVPDGGFGGGKQPVITVTWEDAQRYVAWFSKVTGKTYRLLSEAEYEYAARAGTTTAYPWGDDIDKNKAACDGCGSEWDNMQPSPVGSFDPNGFGLYDMVGNVWQWIEDCEHSNYDGAPTDGSAWIEGGNCNLHTRDRRIVRGGSWASPPEQLRSAFRNGNSRTFGYNRIGFRVGRTLSP
jgi:formylglycine-generating enzyme required for sulfatase activity